MPTYRIHVTDASRRKLDAKRSFGTAKPGRTPLAAYFHGDYVDKRPPDLVAEHRLLSVYHPRRYVATAVSLTDNQVADVLALLMRLDITPTYLRTDKPSSLLGQFLEAVLTGYLQEEAQ